MAIDWTQKKTKEILEQEAIEQKAKQRDIKIVSAIREIYSIDDEIAMIYREDNDPQKIEYRKTVNDIKAKIV